MIEFKTTFPEKKDESLKKVAYLIHNQHRFDLVKYHYFAKKDIVGMVCIFGPSTKKKAMEYIKAYDYTLGDSKTLPEFWEITH